MLSQHSNVLLIQPDVLATAVDKIVLILVQQIVLSVQFIHHCVRDYVPLSKDSSMPVLTNWLYKGSLMLLLMFSLVVVELLSTPKLTSLCCYFMCYLKLLSPLLLRSSFRVSDCTSFKPGRLSPSSAGARSCLFEDRPSCSSAAFYKSSNRPLSKL